MKIYTEYTLNRRMKERDFCSELPALLHIPFFLKKHFEISCKYSVYATLWSKSFCWEVVMKPLKQGSLCLNLKPSCASLNGFQLPISALAYSTTLRKWIQILLPRTQRATRWHAACLEMDVLWRSTEVTPVGYLKGKVGTVRSQS